MFYYSYFPYQYFDWSVFFTIDVRMGRKKKPWIDKRTSSSYKLVYRGQDDPLSKEPGAPQMVLAPLAGDHDSDESDPPEDQFEAQNKLGIHFTDEYDYMQHMKPSSCSLLKTVPLTKETSISLDLPPEVFPSKSLLPPLPPFDPFSETEFIDEDIQAALEGEVDCLDPSSQLEDDFVLQANQVPEGEMFCGEYGAPPGQWRDLLGDYSPWEQPASGEVGKHYDTDRQSKLTDCSMTSSSVPRNEGMQLLDAQFERLIEEYDDGVSGQGANEMVAVDEVGGKGDKLLEQVVRQFKQTRVDSEQGYSLSGKRVAASCGDESSSESDIDTRLDAMLSPAREREQWDCESILSTYSNLYNHPKEIPLPPPLHRKSRPERSDADSADDPLSISVGTGRGKVHSRVRGESSQDRKDRKLAVRTERKEARERKKEMKHIYKAEKINAKICDSSVSMVHVV